MVRVTIVNPEKKVMEIRDVKTVMDVLKRLNLNPDAYIAFVKGRPVPEDENIEEYDELDLMQVFSGG
jgi:sulfur carrier protein ThiS